MTSTDIGDLLETALPTPKPQQRSRSVGQSVDGVLGVLEGLKTPMAQEFGRSVIESVMRQFAPGFSIDDIEQRALRQQQAELLELRTQRELKDMQIRTAIGQLVDVGNQPLSGLGGRSLSDVTGFTVDRSIMSNPEQLMAAAKAALTATGNPLFDIKMSDLLFSGVEGIGTEAREDPEKQAAEREATEAGRIRSAEKQAEFKSEVAAGEATNPLVAALEAQTKAAESATDLDLSPAGMLGNDDFDTALGARHVAGIIARSASASGLGPNAMVTALTTTDHGKRIADALNRAPKNDAGLLTRFEKGGLNGLEAGAVDTYLVLLNEVSKNTGMQLDHLLASMGVDFVGIDAGSLSEAEAAILGQE